jgi:hypothetical protein
MLDDIWVYVKTNGGTLNVRSSPTLSSQVLFELNNGTWASVLNSIDSATVADGFHWVRYRGDVPGGWVAAEFLVFEKARAYVNSPRDGFLNVRSEPDGKIVDKLPTARAGELPPKSDGSFTPVFSHPILSGSHNWVEVGFNRYVASEFLVYAKYSARVNSDGRDVSVHSEPDGDIITTLSDESFVYVFGDPIVKSANEWVAIGPGCYVVSKSLVNPD